MPGDSSAEPSELHALRKIEPHDPDGVLDLERAGEKGMPHAAAGPVVQFDLLEMELRVGKAVSMTTV